MKTMLSKPELELEVFLVSTIAELFRVQGNNLNDKIETNIQLGIPLSTNFLNLDQLNVGIFETFLNRYKDVPVHFSLLSNRSVLGPDGKYAEYIDQDVTYRLISSLFVRQSLTKKFSVVSTNHMLENTKPAPRPDIGLYAETYYTYFDKQAIFLKLVKGTRNLEELNEGITDRIIYYDPEAGFNALVVEQLCYVVDHSINQLYGRKGL